MGNAVSDSEVPKMDWDHANRFKSSLNSAPAEATECSSGQDSAEPADIPYLTRDSSDEDDDGANTKFLLTQAKAEARARALTKAADDKAQGKRFKPSAVKDIPGMDVRPSYWYLKGHECIDLDDGIIDERYWSDKDKLSVQKWRDAKLAEWHAEGKEIRVQCPTEEAVLKWLDEMGNHTKISTCVLRSQPQVYMDLEMGGEPIGRIVIRLRYDVCPRTCENFRQLCTGEAGFGYRNSFFHRFVCSPYGGAAMIFQGGDITTFDGRGGKSIYGRVFPDENFILKHNERGMISSANSGLNTNGSQFFICTGKAHWLDGRHVVFAKLLSGFDVLDKIKQVGSKSGHLGGPPAKKVIVVDCGELEVKPRERK